MGTDGRRERRAAAARVRAVGPRVDTAYNRLNILEYEHAVLLRITDFVGFVDLSIVRQVAVGFQPSRSSDVYFIITSALSSWKSLRPMRTISPWLTHTFFRILPRIWHSRFLPSKQ